MVSPESGSSSRSWSRLFPLLLEYIREVKDKAGAVAQVVGP